MRDEIWTVEEVAERWKVTPRVVREMLVKGELHGFKVRMNWRIYLSDVLDYEQNQNEAEHKRPSNTVTKMPKPIVTRIT
jgi:excisionase family DNA binding protein